MPALIDRYGAPPLKRSRDTFGSLGRAIVYQQLSGSAAGTIYRRLLELFGNSRRFPRPPEILATTEASLRSAGLSRAKASFLHDLARHFDDGRIVPRRLHRASNEEIAAALTQVKGVGPWSVDMFLIFALNRPDVLPVGDLGIRKGMQRYFRKRSLPEAPAMRRMAEPWRPYRSVASWYMWRVAEDGLP